MRSLTLTLCRGGRGDIALKASFKYQNVFGRIGCELPADLVQPGFVRLTCLEQRE